MESEVSQRAAPEGVTALRGAGRPGARHCIIPVLSVTDNRTPRLHIFLHSLVPRTGPTQDLAPGSQRAFNACYLLLGLLLMTAGSLGGRVLGGHKEGSWDGSLGAGGEDQGVVRAGAAGLVCREEDLSFGLDCTCRLPLERRPSPGAHLPPLRSEGGRAVGFSC